MKILVVFTGGTIGSKINNNWIETDKKASYLLIENYLKHDNSINFDVITPYTILSENLSANSLNLLMQTIKNHVSLGYDGIIVTHGTDTIQYTASVLNYSLNKINVPVVLVSSNYTLTDSRSNGFINFEAAVSLIKDHIHAGIFTCYSNNNKDVFIFKGSNLLLHNEMSDSLNVASSNYYAKYISGSICKSNNYIESKLNLPSEFTLVSNPKILVINSYPEDDFEYSLLNRKAIIFKPYHSGTLNTNNDKLKEFCKKAKENKIPLFLVNAADLESYESTKEYNNLGIISLPSATFVDVYVRIWIAISNNENVVNYISDLI